MSNDKKFFEADEGICEINVIHEEAAKRAKNHLLDDNTYMDLSGHGYPLYGAGYISSGPIAEGLNPLLGTYRGGNFGDYVSVTNNLLGGGKYGHTNFPELRNYLRTIDINPEGL